MKGNSNIRGSTGPEREFIKDFNSLSVSHNAWTVWQDFVDMSAYSLVNTVDKRDEVWKKREAAYLEIVKKYSHEELDTIVKLFATTVMALEDNPAQDFLGKLYMDFNFGGRSGQFFTPWSVAELMAELEIGGDFRQRLETENYLSVNDPACGAGCMLIAFANVCRRNYGVNYQQSIFFVAQDIDPVVAKMCYIQLSLLGCPGYVAIGNTITSPVLGSVLNPYYDPPENLWFTPFYFSTVWNIRRLSESLCSIMEKVPPEPETNRPEVYQKHTPPKPKPAPVSHPVRKTTSFSIRDFFKKGIKKK